MMHQNRNRLNTGWTSKAVYMVNRRLTGGSVMPQSRNDILCGDQSRGFDLQEEHEDTSRRQRFSSFFLFQVTAIASLGGILFGYDLGVIAGALPLLAEDFSLSSHQQEIVVAILYVGGGLGSTVGGALCDMGGRRWTILWTDVVFLLASVIFAFASSYWHLLVGRIVVGWAVAVSGVADVSYLHEISPTHIRGAVVSVNEACIALGFLSAFGAGHCLRHLPEGWRYMFGLSGVLAIVQFIGMLGMPESPIWLKKHGRQEESEVALRKVFSEASISRNAVNQSPDGKLMERNDPSYQADVNLEHESYMQEIYPLPPSLPVESNLFQKATYGIHLLRSMAVQSLHFCRETLRRYWRQAWIAVFLSVGQQLSGQAVVISYAPTIFVEPSEENSRDQESWGTLSIGFVKFIVTCLVVWKVERIGRRALLLVGLGTICSGLFLLCISFSTINPESSQARRGFALPGIWLVVVGYSMSYGPLTWLLTSELFPTEIRGRAIGLGAIVTNAFAFLVTGSFLSMRESLGTTFVFAFYLVCTLTGILFAYLAIPETAEKNSNEIENCLGTMWWWRSRDATENAVDESVTYRRALGNDSIHQPQSS